jgi:hypothetical protein
MPSNREAAGTPRERHVRCRRVVRRVMAALLPVMLATADPASAQTILGTIRVTIRAPQFAPTSASGYSEDDRPCQLVEPLRCDASWRAVAPGASAGGEAPDRPFSPNAESRPGPAPRG